MKKEKKKWKKRYSIVLLINALYIILFYLLMEFYK